MSEYKEEPITTAKKRQRARQIVIRNEHDETPKVIFMEEEVFELDGAIITRGISEVLEKEFTIANSGTSFDLMNPTDNTVIKDATMTYGELYAALYSLYFHLAGDRDDALSVTSGE